MVIATLSIAETLFIPIFMAALIAMLLQIPLKSLERIGVPRWVGALILTLTIGTAIWAVTLLIAEPLEYFADNHRQVGIELRQKITDFQYSFGEAAQLSSTLSDLSDDMNETLEDPSVQEVVVRDSNFLVEAASSVAQSATTFMATLIICAFILTIRQPFTTMVTMFSGEIGVKRRAAKVWLGVEENITYFFFVTTMINFGLGLIVGTALYFLDVPMAGFWGVAVGILNYMPFVGPTIGALSLFAFCLLQFSSLWAILLPPGIYLLINFFEANFVTPSLVSRKTEIPTLAIVLSLFFWGWLWGFIGLFFAIPVLVIAKAISTQIDALTPLSRILTPRKS